MFSATFPRSMEALARRILTKPLEVTVGGKSVVCDDVTQNVTVLSEEDKFLKLLELLGKFTQTYYFRGKLWFLNANDEFQENSKKKDPLSFSFISTKSQMPSYAKS